MNNDEPISKRIIKMITDEPISKRTFEEHKTKLRNLINFSKLFDVFIIIVITIIMIYSYMSYNDNNMLKLIIAYHVEHEQQDTIEFDKLKSRLEIIEYKLNKN